MTSTTPPRYTPLEDLQGLAVSVIGSALGMVLLSSAGLITGGTAGLALLLGHGFGWAFGPTFFLVNLPFYLIAWRQRGAVFALKSLGAVSAVSWLAEALPRWMQLDYVHPGVAALLFGVICGVALLGLFRHGSSLGGISIIAVLIQERTGVRAGWVQLGWDAALFAVAVFLLPLSQVFWSLIGAVFLNFVIAMNHRRDWYLPG